MEIELPADIPGAQIRCPRFATDGRTLTGVISVYGKHASIGVWDAGTGRLERHFGEGSATARELVLTADSEHVVALLSTGAWAWSRRTSGFEGQVVAADRAVLSDSGDVATVMADRSGDEILRVLSPFRDA